jgi:hypothetical protein
VRTPSGVSPRCSARSAFAGAVKGSHPHSSARRDPRARLSAAARLGHDERRPGGCAARGDRRRPSRRSRVRRRCPVAVIDTPGAAAAATRPRENRGGRQRADHGDHPRRRRPKRRTPPASSPSGAPIRRRCDGAAGSPSCPSRPRPIGASERPTQTTLQRDGLAQHPFSDLERQPRRRDRAGRTQSSAAFLGSSRTAGVRRGGHNTPRCEHGAWWFAGSDSKRGERKRCPTGECNPASVWIGPSACSCSARARRPLDRSLRPLRRRRARVGTAKA